MKIVDCVDGLTVVSDECLPPGFVMLYSSPYSTWDQVGPHWTTLDGWLSFAVVYNDFPRRTREELIWTVLAESAVLLWRHAHHKRKDS